MKRLGLIAAATLICLTGETQEIAGKRLSNESLPATNQAIYQSYLQRYRSRHPERSLLATETNPFILDQRRLGNCLDGIEMPPSAAVIRETHLLPKSLTESGMKLVDAKTQTAKIEKAFAKSLPPEGLGFVSLSEIAVDMTGNTAFFNVSYYCGGLCGDGSTIMMKRTPSGWTFSKSCGAWIS